jgi:HEAT repeat protein
MSQDLSVSSQLARILAALHGDRRADRDNAIAELKSLDHTQAIHELAHLLRDPEPSQRSLAVEAMILLDAKRTLEYVLPLLMDNDPEVRWDVCYWLHEFGDQRAVEPLIRVLLNDPDVNVRTEAASVLGASRDPRAIPALMDARAHDFEKDRQGYIVSEEAKKSLRNMGIE